VAHSIQIFPRARADIRAAVTWLHERSPSAAARLHAGLLAAIRSLATSPQRCPLADEATDLGMELRELLHRRHRNVYRILFTIEGETVNILRVRHSAQDHLFPDDV
jgi:plasmid stabilization system protein ParE